MIRLFGLVVVAVLLFIAGCSSPADELRKKEDVLKQDLYSMRQAIDQYTQEKKKAPTSLEDLVKAGYLYKIPIDPITRSRLTWKVIQEDIDDRVHPSTPGVTDVHSGSDRLGSDGTRYSDW